MVKKETKKEKERKSKSYTVEDLIKKFNSGINKSKDKK